MIFIKFPRRRDAKFMEDLQMIWNSVLEAMRSGCGMSDAVIDLWFADIKLRELTDKSAHLVHNSDFKAGIVNKRYLDTVRQYMNEVLGFEVEIELTSSEGEIPEKEEQEAAAALEQSEDAAPKKPETPPAEEEPTFYSTAESSHKSGKLIMPPGFSKDYTFENFIVGGSNKFVHAACLAVAEYPATEYNPLFIHGSSGLGKTHLLYAITNRKVEKNPDINVLYVKGEEFTNQLIESIGNNTTAKFRDRYRKVDVLLIDDIQFIAGKESTQEEFFHTFNTLYEENKQIIMTSDRPPRDIEHLENRLRTRFEWGLVADIQPPDFELRVAIMQNKAKMLGDRGLRIPHEVFVFLAENLTSNIRQMEGVIKKIAAKSFLMNTPVTVDLAMSCIKDILSSQKPTAVTAEKIIDKVAKKYGVTASDVRGKSRTKEISTARHVSIYMIRTLTDLSLPKIGKLFNRNHATVLSSLKTVKTDMANDSVFEIEIKKLINEIRN